MIELKGKKVLVVGLGRSGQAAARVCSDQGAIVTVTDRRGPEALASARANLAPGTSEELGGHREATFLTTDLIVLSPGVPELPEIVAARRAGVAITGELELGSWFNQGTMVAVTGTNGKSTTTTLCGNIVRATGDRKSVV